MLKSQKLLEQMSDVWSKIKGIRDVVVEEDRDFTQEEHDRIEKALDEIRSIEIQVEVARADESMHDEL